MWKMLCTNKRRDLLQMDKPRTLPREKKGCRKGARGFGELIHIDPTRLKGDRKIMYGLD